MNNEEKKKKYLESAKSLRKHFDSEQFRSMQPEHAFIRWYIDARFGKIGENNCKIFDSAGDGGVDAIVETGNTIFVLQMKYEVRPRISKVSKDEIAGFEKVARVLTDGDASSEFDNWMQEVALKFQSDYKVVSKALKKESKNVRFIFVTSKSTDLISNIIEIEDIKNILSLWDLYYEGFCPPVEKIELSLQDSWTSNGEDEKFKTYVGMADVRDFLTLMDKDKNKRLFAQNVRSNLNSKINKKIQETYENNSENFWLGNNGVYIVCKEVSINGKNFTLNYPSVINGSQTLYSIYGSNKRRHSCRILVRILEIDVFNERELLGSVIRRTNTQNAMDPINLHAHDFEQLYIARFLDKFQIFYERREREWAQEKRGVLMGYIPLRIKELGQWLAITCSGVGLGRSRSNVKSLFEEDLYDKIFSGFVEDESSTSYRYLPKVVWSGLFIKELIWYLPETKKSKARMSRLLLVKATYDVIRSSNFLQKNIKESLRKHEYGNGNIPRKIVKEYSKIISEFTKIVRKHQQKDETIVFSNFFKRDNFTEEAFEKVFTKTRMNRMKKLFEDNLGKIN